MSFGRVLAAIAVLASLVTLAVLPAAVALGFAPGAASAVLAAGPGLAVLVGVLKLTAFFWGLASRGSDPEPRAPALVIG